MLNSTDIFRTLELPKDPEPNLSGISDLKDNVVKDDKSTDEAVYDRYGNLVSGTPPPTGLKDPITPEPIAPNYPTAFQAVEPEEQVLTEGVPMTPTVVPPPPEPVAPPPLPTSEPMPVKQEEVAKTTFSLVDPETGETIEFDDQVKFNKARINQAKQIEEKKIDDEEDGDLDDLIAAGTALAKSFADGNDPVRDAQFNWQIQKMGPLNQATTAATKMSLKAAGVDPNAPGAGQAIMTQIARQSGQTFSDVVNSLNVDSAERMIDMTKWGVDHATKVQKHRQQQKVDNWNFNANEINYLANVIKTDDPAAYEDILASMNLPIGTDYSQLIKEITSGNAIENSSAQRTLTGDYTDQRNLFNSLMPGVDYDQTALSGLGTTEYSDVLTWAQAIDTALSKGPAGKAEAKQLLLDAQKAHPDVFDGDYSEWDPDKFNPSDVFSVKKGLLTDLSQMVFNAGTNTGDLTEASEWAAEYLIDPATVDAKFDKLWETTNPQQQARLIELAGLEGEPLTPEDKQLILGADEVRGQQDTADPIQRMYDVFYQGSSPEFKEWIQSGTGENASAFRQYLFELSNGGAAELIDGKLVIDERKLLDPTNTNSRIAHYYMDWPVGVDDDGAWHDPEEWGTKSAPGTYSGNQPIGDENMGGGDVYQEEVNKAWENYVNVGGKKSRMDWFKEAQPDVNGATQTVAIEENEEPDNPSGVTEEDLLGVQTFVSDVVSGKVELKDLTAPQLLSLLTADLSVLEKSDGLKAYVPGGHKDFPDMSEMNGFTEWAITNKINLMPASEPGPGFENAPDLKDIMPGQKLILGGTVFELEFWNDGSLYGINQSTGKREKIHSWG